MEIMLVIFYRKSQILEKKCPFSRNNNTALIKQISLFDIDKNLKF